MTVEAAARVEGKVIQIIGAVLDVEFPPGHLPAILNALEVERPDGSKMIIEVEQHLGNNWVRCVAMDTTEVWSFRYDALIAACAREPVLLSGQGAALPRA